MKLCNQMNVLFDKILENSISSNKYCLTFLPNFLIFALSTKIKKLYVSYLIEYILLKYLFLVERIEMI